MARRERQQQGLQHPERKNRPIIGRWAVMQNVLYDFKMNVLEYQSGALAPVSGQSTFKGHPFPALAGLAVVLMSDQTAGNVVRMFTAGFFKVFLADGKHNQNLHFQKSGWNVAETFYTWTVKRLAVVVLVYCAAISGRAFFRAVVSMRDVVTGFQDTL